MRPSFDKDGIVLYQGDCLEVMSQLPKCSVDAVITDPPYGIRFMGKAWDGADIERQARHNACTRKPRTDGRRVPRDGLAAHAGSYDLSLTGNRVYQDWCVKWAEAALRVTKPGAFLLAFGGTRTFHRLACALEEAGWIIRDCIMWLYGSGFPKSMDISKAIDKAAGAKRRTVGVSSGPNHSRYTGTRYTQNRKTLFGVIQDQPDLTAPNTSAAKIWHGWGTALKPAWEPIIVAMKPLDGTFAENALKHGVSGLWIDGAKIGCFQSTTPGGFDRYNKGLAEQGYRPNDYQKDAPPLPFSRRRWPANLLLTHHPECEVLDTRQVKSNGHFPARRGSGGIGTSGHKGQRNLEEHHSSGEIAERWQCHPDCPIATLDEQSGERPAGGTPKRRSARKTEHIYGEYGTACPPGIGRSTGGASRFFYCAKASRSERNEGLNCMPKKMLRWSSGPKSPGTFQSEGTDKYVHNHHPTVKPLKLMEYLCKLTATPTEGTILDPFAGSGSTMIAAANVGRRCIGIECDRDYVRIAQARLRAHATKKLKGGLGKAASCSRV